jgi:hypothetical protein
MGRKLLQLKGRNAAEQMKIDQMFAQTREMLVKNISPAIIRELEDAVLAAERQGASGQSPPPAQVAAPTEQPSGTETSGGEPAGGESNAAE